MGDVNIFAADGWQTTNEAVGVGAVYDELRETGMGRDELAALIASLPVSDVGTGADSVALSASLATTDAGQGTDSATVGKFFFLIDDKNILQPIGVIVLRGEGSEDLLPGTRDDSEDVPGRDGEIDFGCDFKPRTLELKVSAKTDAVSREQLKRTITRWLNPKAGAKPLAFSDDIEKTYYVRYAGKIDPSQWVDYLEFTIPFKASDPLIYGTYEKTKTGSGTLVNAGNYETPLAITIYGPVVNPQVSIGNTALSYTGVLAESDILTIDTGSMTVKLNGANAMAGYTGGFPKLQPGDTAVMAAAAGVTTFTWRDRWI